LITARSKNASRSLGSAMPLTEKRGRPERVLLAQRLHSGAIVMSIILFVVFGLIVGLLARALLPGRQSMGLLMTALLGVAGSFVGGFLASLITDSRVTDLNTAGIIGSVIGAILLLVLVGARGRHAHV
jgi:uncharacterized membrane protein YeaQ/YmgE (transglycosylase-associated protein family)